MAPISFSGRLSPSCQQIIHENLTPNAATNPSILIRSSLADTDLMPAITNHKCNNVILTPSGLYFDMALTVARYICSKIGRTPLPAFAVCDMEVHKPLIIKDVALISEACIEMDTTIHREGSDIGNLHCTFHSATPTGTRLQTMGSCVVRFEDSDTWRESWEHLTPTIRDRIESLQTRAKKESSGVVRLVQKKEAYKLFESFVQYTGEYQNMAEVIFDEEMLEATSLLDLGDLNKGAMGPYLWDGSCHVSGFVCNAVEKDRGKNAYISHGVEGMRMSERFTPSTKGVEIRNYVRMEVEGTVLRGDVYVLQGEEIVGLWEGVRFKRIPRRVLDVFLPPGKK